jgi:hypothetical protein
MTTATTQQLIIKRYTCINLHEQANDLTAECNKHHKILTN